MPVKDLTNQRFGRLTVIELFDTNKGYARWKCICDCGSESIVLGTHLRAKNTSSCGCLQKDTAKEQKLKHGGHGTKTYESWQNMIRRCVDSKTKRFHRYGGRGITVCKEWRESFESFLADMGERPEGTSLERKDGDKGYYKENCEWLAKSENTIDTYRGNPTKRALAKRLA